MKCTIRRFKVGTTYWCRERDNYNAIHDFTVVARCNNRLELRSADGKPRLVLVEVNPDKEEFAELDHGMRLYADLCHHNRGEVKA